MTGSCRPDELAEPPNGWLENVPGFRQFGLRGLHRVRAACKLVCPALNLRRMAVLAQAGQQRKKSSN